MSYFHFTLGPVQSFVAQARRTRDFWAGSFILSWLSAVAMREVLVQSSQNVIEFPKPDEEFMRFLCEGLTFAGGAKRYGPSLASIPNRFMARVDDLFNPEQVKAAVCKAWHGIADEVWQRDLDGYIGTKTQMIWQRQIESFWEINWALVDDPSDTQVLDRRKHWRSHLPPAEPGVKCMLMDGWQELSGAESPTRGIGPGDPKHDLTKFWKELRDSGNSSLKRDLRPREHLCAMAFIKRRFPRHFEHVKVEMPSGWTAHGWPVPQTVPSVVYLAAVPWLVAVIQKCELSALEDFEEESLKLLRAEVEWSVTDEYLTKISRIDGAIASRTTASLKKFHALEGSVFYENRLLDKEEFEDQEQAEIVAGRLRTLRVTSGEGEPSQFYSVLRMDGDELGKRMTETEFRAPIADALYRFTKSVDDIVKQRSGFLVYAGGDDVLALLPIDEALDCAASIRKSYQLCFEQVFDGRPKQFKATISAAIVYAHMKIPLTRVLADSHDLLDDVAKADRGRDAVACRIRKPGHLAVEWGMGWDRAVSDEEVVVQALARKIAEPGDTALFANRFFYKIRDLLEPLQAETAPKGMEVRDFGIQLMTAEYLASGAHSERPRRDRLDVEQSVARLLDQCEIRRRIETSNGVHDYVTTGRWSADGALLVRFLAQKGGDR